MGSSVERDQHLTRRHFFGRASTGLGTIALASLLDRDLFAGDRGGRQAAPGAGIEGFPNVAPRARRVIYLFQSGAPRSSTCSTPSRGSIDSKAPICRTRSGWDNG